MSRLIEVEDLGVSYPTSAGPLRVVDGLSFSLDEGDALGVVGESGSGKSQTALALLGLLPPTAQVSGRARFAGQDLLASASRLRGREIALVFQDAMTALNPHLRIGRQMSEVLETHRGLAHAAALAESARMLDAVRIPEAVQMLGRYPHELSGGQRQRVLLAQALLCRPRLLIADEPTTALDVTVQAQILKLLAELRRELGLALLLISHDLGVVAELCARVLVLQGGRLMEQGRVEAVLHQPEHPYTQALIEARPRLDLPLFSPG